MALISPADQQKLQESFAEMTRPVRLLFFTQTFGCETCPETRQILAELPPLSDKITIEEVNLILEGERAEEYGIDRAPAIAVIYSDGSIGSLGPPGSLGSEGSVGSQNPWRDSRIRFLGAPAGYEFISLVQAVLLAGGGLSGLADESRKRIALVDRPVTMQVFTTPT